VKLVTALLRTESAVRLCFGQARHPSRRTGGFAMKHLALGIVFAAGFAAAHLIGGTTAADPKPVPPPNGPNANPNIDMLAHMVATQNAAKHRATRRLNEDDFIKMSKEEGVIVLDARSKAMFDLMHIDGAINLNFSDIDVNSLKKLLPNKDAKILIYCNNNFTAAPDLPANIVIQQQVTPNGGVPVPDAAKRAEISKVAFGGKGLAVSLNLSTYTTLHSYGYKNVYELGPTLDAATTKLKLVYKDK
jgi:Rhodanese-like domain